LGCVLILAEDLEGLKRISARLKKRNDAAVRHRPKLDQRKRPKGPEWAKLMNARRMLVQPVAERRRLARRAAILRWRAVKEAARRP
jgi:hypothetical protein